MYDVYERHSKLISLDSNLQGTYSGVPIYHYNCTMAFPDGAEYPIYDPHNDMMGTERTSVIEKRLTERIPYILLINSNSKKENFYFRKLDTNLQH